MYLRQMLALLKHVQLCGCAHVCLMCTVLMCPQSYGFVGVSRSDLLCQVNAQT